MAETAFSNAAREYIKSRGGYVEKTWGTALSGSGRPDRHICYRGCFVVFELKRPNLKLSSVNLLDNDRFASTAQQFHLQAIRKAGGIAYVVNTLEQIGSVLDRIDASIYKG
jgi:hypothetical protein